MLPIGDEHAMILLHALKVVMEGKVIASAEEAIG